MPDRSGEDAGKSHRKHEFPGKIHHLIDPGARERAAHPDEDEKEQAKLGEKPKIRRHKFQEGQGRVPAAEKERYRQSANGKHTEIFRLEKSGILEARIFRHVAGDDF